MQRRGASPRQIQHYLAAHGYKITVDGIMGPQTKAAMAAFQKGVSAKDWNKNKIQSGGKSGPGSLGSRFISQTKSVIKNAPPKLPKPKLGAGGPNMAGLAAIGANIGLDTPESAAGSLADLQYGSAVRDAQSQLDKAPAQGAQNQHDIGHWYDQVLASQATAGTRDAEIGKASTASVGDAVASIIASLGGSANEGSAAVGQAGVDNAGMMAALGSSQDRYNQDMRPLLNAESAGARTSETVRQGNLVRDLHAQLTDAQDKRGSAQVQALMDIRNSNNQLAQTRFGNQMTLEQMRAAQRVAGVKVASTKSGFNNTDPRVKNAAFNQALTLAGDFIDPNTKQLKDGSIPSVVQRINGVVRSYGWSLTNPNVLAWRNSVLKTVGVTPDPSWH